MKVTKLKNGTVSSIDANKNKIQVNIDEHIYQNIGQNADVSDSNSDISEVSNMKVEYEPDIIDYFVSDSCCKIISYMLIYLVAIISLSSNYSFIFGNVHTNTNTNTPVLDSNIDKYTLLNKKYEELSDLVKSNSVRIKASEHSKDTLVKTVLNQNSQIELLSSQIAELSNAVKQNEKLRESQYMLLTTNNKNLLDSTVSYIDNLNRKTQEIKDKLTDLTIFAKDTREELIILKSNNNGLGKITTDTIKELRQSSNELNNKYKKLSKSVEKQEYNLKSQFEKLDYMKVNKDEIAHLLKKKTAGIFLEY